MPLRRIKKYDRQMFCTNFDHNPPTMVGLDPGEYEHICPGCGKKTILSVPLIQS